MTGTTRFILSPAAFLFGMLVSLPTLGQDNPSTNREAAQIGETDRQRLLSLGEEEEPPAQIPYLYEGELEDIGPQMLLVPGSPKHLWFQALIDSQWYYNSNPTMTTSSQKVETDVWITTAELSVTTPAIETPGIGETEGLLEFSAGGWAQTYLYGTLSGRDEIVQGIPMKDNDFTGITLFGEIDYEQGPLFAGMGLRWTRLSNTNGSDGFYREWVPSWEVGYRIYPNATNLVTFRYDGSWHSTENETFNTLRDDLNNRWSNTLSAVWTHLLAPNWFLQPYAALTYDSYTDADGREDLTGLAGIVLAWQVNDYFTARLFASYRHHDSNKDYIADYDQFNSGLGASLSTSF
ncbi:MAG: hypothetical protein ACQKBU_00600 [Verrucomicrobiales bacterium]